MSKTNIQFITLMTLVCLSEVIAGVHIVPLAKGWAKNSINAVIFRRNSVVTHKETQYVAYYDANGFVVLAKRMLNSMKWEIRRTQYKGNIKDAHNSISIMVDGDGYLHMSWDHHNDPLRYCRSETPGSLELTATMPMTGMNEDRVTYPEFYRLSNGDLIFLYRDGASGRGNLMMNHYDLKNQEWTQRQDAFINGEGQRNAYWQMCTDTKGAIHISWVWRETGDVATNHDMCYAKSTDGGKTWLKSSGEVYNLPITASNAEYAALIPQKSELANTTAMCADSKGRPYIATFWRPQDKKVPQYHLVFHDGVKWQKHQISNRTTPFSLSGHGEKRVPVSRCQIFADSDGMTDKVYVLFRDTERKDHVSVAICENLLEKKWQIKDLTDFAVGMWEPSYDTELWKRSKILHVYLQKVGQGDGGKLEEIPPQDISILEWKPE
ncbi:neuraminidase [bacterium I07]|nr:neuraminidase [bacterium I07]